MESDMIAIRSLHAFLKGSTLDGEEECGDCSSDPSSILV